MRGIDESGIVADIGGIDFAVGRIAKDTIRAFVKKCGNPSPKDLGIKLEDFLSDKVFKGVKATLMRPEKADADGFNAWMKDYRAALEAERVAVNG